MEEMFRKIRKMLFTILCKITILLRVTVHMHIQYKPKSPQVRSVTRKCVKTGFLLGVVCLPSTAIGDDGKHLVSKGVAAE